MKIDIEVLPLQKQFESCAPEIVATWRILQKHGLNPVVHAMATNIVADSIDRVFPAISDILTELHQELVLPEVAIDLRIDTVTDPSEQA